MSFDSRIKEILITEEEINREIKKAGKWIDNNYKNSDLILIGFLRGCVPFFGRLMTSITIDFVTDFMVWSSFKGQDSRQTKPEIITDILIDIKGKDVLIIEDIIDTAETLHYALEHLKKKQPKSIKILTMLNKQEGRKVNLNPDYTCFDVENKFLVGFGLDYKEQLRNLPYVGVFKTSK